MAPRKTAAKRIAGKKSSLKKVRDAAPQAMPKGGRDPKGGLTAQGRAYFNEKEGSHLRPGVQGPADTPEKMVRKGSFLRRHFANPRGPMQSEKGEPTRLALSAHAWGEPVPKTPGDAKKLASKGHELLEQYHKLQDDTESSSKAKRAGSKRGTSATVGKKTAAKGGAAKKQAAKKAVKSAAKKQV